MIRVVLILFIFCFSTLLAFGEQDQSTTVMQQHIKDRCRNKADKSLSDSKHEDIADGQLSELIDQLKSFKISKHEVSIKMRELRRKLKDSPLDKNELEVQLKIITAQRDEIIRKIQSLRIEIEEVHPEVRKLREQKFEDCMNKNGITQF